ncbi:MAG: hemolysin family protein, partial [Propionibacteriales bacterium]|nr:hemolysin family protein [Propionibacteriales bacterium]
MNSGQLLALGIALILVILGGLIAAGEAAMHSFSRARAAELLAEGRPGAKTLVRIVSDLPAYLNTALFVRLALEISAIVSVAWVVFDLVEATWLQILITAGSMLVVSYIAWGVAPRTLGRQHSTAVACAFAGPLVAMTTVLGPLSRLLIIIGNALTPGKGFTEGPFSSETELREMVDLAEASELIESEERAMIHSVFELGDTVVREVMVPRPDMVFIERHRSIRQGVALALRSGFSRIPVVGEGLDDVVGVLYLKDMIRQMYDHPDRQMSQQVSAVMREPQWCPDSKPADELLREMQLTHSHLVIVVDEFGGTAGMATIEDILEEIVGEIRDEYDHAEVAPVTELADGRFRVSARLPIDELGELFGKDLDDDDVDSVGGLMAKELNR